MPNFVPGSGPSSASLMVVGEAPGYYEDVEQECLVGPTGKLTDKMLTKAGMPLRECYKTNVEKYRPPANNLKLFHLIDRKPYQDLDLLKEEIAQIKPNAILSLGDHALYALAGKRGKHNGIKQYRGSILKCVFDPKIKVIPSIHPAHTMPRKDAQGYDYKARFYIQLDIEKAVRESRFQGFDSIPKRTLEICKTSQQLYRFLEKYRHLKKVSVDIEVIKCVPVCVGLAFNATHGLSIPLLPIETPSKFKLADAEYFYIWKMLDELFRDPSIQIIGQNFKFDHTKLEKPFGFKILSQIWFDCAFAQHTLYSELPKALEFQTSIWTDEPYYKSELHEFNADREPFENLLYYNAKDVVVPYEIHEKQLEEIRERGLERFFFEFMMPLHTLYYDMEKEGCRVDMEKRLAIYRSFRQKELEVDLEIMQLAGRPVNLNSPKDVGVFLYDDLKFPRRDSTDKSTVAALYANHAKDERKKRGIELLQSGRSLKKTIQTYIVAKPDYDLRMRTSVNITGAETGRTTNNMLDPPVRPHDIGMAFHTISKHGEVGPQIRWEFIADEGCVIGAADSSAGDARIVAHLAHDEQLIRDFANGVDIHSKTAGWIFKKDPADIVKEERFIGKKGRHGYAYREGKKKLAEDVNTEAHRFGIPIKISEYFAGQIIDVMEANCPQIKERYWPEVEAACRSNGMTLINPWGRPRTFFGEQNERLLNEMMAHLPQSTLSDNTKFAALRIKKRKPSLRLWAENHDDLKWHSKIEDFEEDALIVMEEMERPIDFSQCSLSRGELIIPCEVEVGINLKEMIKWHPGQKIAF